MLSEAHTASAEALEENIRDLSTNHTALHEEVTFLKNNLQLLSQSIAELDRNIEIKNQKSDRRMAKLETQQRELLDALGRIAQAEGATQRQIQEIAKCMGYVAAHLRTCVGLVQFLRRDPSSQSQ